MFAAADSRGIISQNWRSGGARDHTTGTKDNPASANSEMRRYRRGWHQISRYLDIQMSPQKLAVVAGCLGDYQLWQGHGRGMRGGTLLQILINHNL